MPRKFNELLPAHRGRPTALLPLWHLAGYALGAGGALLGGARGAMAVTVAVEATITDHYNDQIRALIDQDPEGKWCRYLKHSITLSIFYEPAKICVKNWMGR